MLKINIEKLAHIRVREKNGLKNFQGASMKKKYFEATNELNCHRKQFVRYTEVDLQSSSGQLQTNAGNSRLQASRKTHLRFVQSLQARHKSPADEEVSPV